MKRANKNQFSSQVKFNAFNAFRVRTKTENLDVNTYKQMNQTNLKRLRRINDDEKIIRK